MNNEMPKEIGICAFVDGTYEVYTESADTPPATKYVRADLVPQAQDNTKALEALDDLEESVRYEGIDYPNEISWIKTIREALEGK